MTDETVSDGAPEGADDADPEGHPKGTLVLSALFIVLMAGTWLFAYFTMIVRS